MWRTAKLGDVCTIVNGGTPKSNVKNYWDGDIKWLTPKDMGKLQDKYVRNTERQITAGGLANSSAKLVPENSIIFSCRAPIGHVFINDCEMSFNQGCKALIPSKDLLVDYLYYFLFASKKLLNDLGTGTTFKEISGKTLSNVTIPLPPLAEQQRIVAKLDAAFAEIDRAIEAERHSAVLNEKLFSNTLEQLFDEIRLQTGSVELGRVSAKIQDGAHHSPKNVFDEKSDNKFPYVTSKNIRTNYMKLDTIKYVDADFHQSIYPRCDAKFGDVLLTKDGASTGNICLNELNEPASLLSSVCLIRGTENQILNEYICFYLQSPTGFQAVTGSMTGAAIKRIILKTIKKTPVPLPSIEEQKKLCKTAEELLKITGYLSKIYASKIRNYEALKSAILAQELQPSEAA